MKAGPCRRATAQQYDLRTASKRYYASVEHYHYCPYSSNLSRSLSPYIEVRMEQDGNSTPASGVHTLSEFTAYRIRHTHKHPKSEVVALHVSSPGFESGMAIYFVFNFQFFFSGSFTLVDLSMTSVTLLCRSPYLWRAGWFACVLVFKGYHIACVISEGRRGGGGILCHRATIRRSSGGFTKNRTPVLMVEFNFSKAYESVIFYATMAYILTCGFPSWKCCVNLRITGRVSHRGSHL